jgi:hypothetical protein
MARVRESGGEGTFAGTRTNDKVAPKRTFSFEHHADLVSCLLHILGYGRMTRCGRRSVLS